MRREQMIEALVIDSLVNILDRERIFRLQSIFEDGFPGYASMSTEELRAEIDRRGIHPDASREATEDEHGNDDELYARNLALSNVERNRRDARAFEAE